MESEDWEHPPTPPPKDARYVTTAINTAAMDADGSFAPASGSKRKRGVQDFNDTVYERRNGQLKAVNGEEDLPTPQKRPRSHAGNYSEDDAASAQHRQKGSLRRKRGFGNLSNMNLRHAASSAFRNESPSRESRFQEGSLNDKPSQQPPSVFTRIARTDSGNLQQVDELMNDYHEGIAAPRDSTEEYQRATIEYEKATMPARVAEITEQRKKEEGKRGMFRFGKSFTNNFHPVQLWNKMWAESKEELMTRNRLEAEREAERKARERAEERAEIQARYDQMKRDGLFNTQHVPFAGKARADTLPTQDHDMVDNEHDTNIHQHVDSIEIPRPQANVASTASIDAREAYEEAEVDKAIPTTATKSRFSRLHFKTPSISNLRDTFRSVRSVRSHSALGGAVDRDSSASVSVSPAKADLSTLKKSISRYDLKKERRLSNRVSDLESKLNKARMELKNALDDASPMPKLGSRYERFTPIGTTKRSRFVPGALATLPSERLMFPDVSTSDANEEQQSRFMVSELRPRNTLQLNDGMDIDKAFPTIDDEDDVLARKSGEDAQSGPEYSTRESEDPIEINTRSAEIEATDTTGTANLDGEEVAANHPANPTLGAKSGALEASSKASNKPAKSRKRRSAAAIDDEKLYRPGREGEESSDEEMVPQKKRKSGGKTANSGGKKGPGEKAAKKTSIPVAVNNSKNRGKKASKTAQDFFTTGKLDEVDSDSPDELAPAVVAGADSDVPSLEPVYEEEEEVTTIPLKDEPSKPTAKSTPARYGIEKASPHSSSPHKKRSDSLQPAVGGARAPGRVTDHRRSGVRSPPPQSHRTVVVEGAVVAVPGENGVPNLPGGDKNWSWPPDVF